MDFIVGIFEQVFKKDYIQRVPESEMIVETESELLSYNRSMREGGVAWPYIIYTAYFMSQSIQRCTHVLDIGCGSADLLMLVAKANPHITFVGVDQSDIAIHEGQKKILEEGISNVTLIQSNLTTLSNLNDQSFDGVISRFALHHLRDIQQLESASMSLRRVLKHGGALCIIDFKRLKSYRLMKYVAYRNKKNAGELVSRLFYESLNAAYTKMDIEKYLSRNNVFLHTSVFTPFYICLHSKMYKLTPSTLQYFTKIINSLPLRKRALVRTLMRLPISMHSFKKIP